MAFFEMTSTRKKALNVTVGADVRNTIAVVAAKERRSVASLVDSILAEWLKARGHLPADSRAPADPVDGWSI
jgi:hypothetical protein